MILDPPTLGSNAKELKPSTNGLRVLVADDHEFILARVVSLLQHHFTIVGTASNGEMLVQEALRVQPDIIVSDIMMPNLTGIEAARRLRESGCLSKFIFMSVYERSDFVKACFAEGASGFVTKTRMGTDLVQAINNAVSGRQFVSPTIADL